jgi:hypothetical protein
MRWAWRLRDRAALAAYQQRQLARLMAEAASALPFYRAYQERPFADWPVIDKTILLKNFSAMNRAGMALERVRAALARGDEHAHAHCACSTSAARSRQWQGVRRSSGLRNIN